MRVCYNITSKCNRNCRYCFKFEKKDLSLEDNVKVLQNLVKNGVSKISWTGGEPFLYDGLFKLLKMSKDYGIINSVNTNLTTVDASNLKEKLENVDRLIVSLDFISDILNEEYGIGKDYYKHVSSILKLIKEVRPDIILQINTVLFRGNIDFIKDLYDELCHYDIDCWKIIRFLPIRGKAYSLKDDLSISDAEFKQVYERFINSRQPFKIIIHGLKEMEMRHDIVLSNGDVIYSEKGKDIKVKSLV